MRRSLLIAFFCLACLGVNAQTMQFLNVSANPRTSAFAGAAVAVDAGATAVDDNLAAASFSESRVEVALGYGLWQPRCSRTEVMSAGGFARLGDRFSIGASMRNFVEPSYDIYTEDGLVGDSFAPKEKAFGLGVSYRFLDCLSVGLSAKLASSSLAKSASARAVCADVTLSYRQGPVRAGAALCNLGGKVDYGTGTSYSLPSVARAGAAVVISGLTGSLEVDYSFSGAFSAAAGAEYCLADIILLRLGAHYGDGKLSAPAYACAGVGLRVFCLNLDASYIFASETLGGSMCFSLGVRF